MKTLLLVRHAKSSWDLATLNDFDRSLNERGKKDAPVMAQRLLDRKIDINIFVSSPAKRAKKTAELFCSIYKKDKEQIIFVPALYHASLNTFFEVVTQLNDDYNCVAIFSHNPVITEFVNQLVENVTIAGSNVSFAMEQKLRRCFTISAASCVCSSIDSSPIAASAISNLRTNQLSAQRFICCIARSHC